jgi:hypothetical protein
MVLSELNLKIAIRLIPIPLLSQVLAEYQVEMKKLTIAREIVKKINR